MLCIHHSPLGQSLLIEIAHYSPLGYIHLLRYIRTSSSPDQSLSTELNKSIEASIGTYNSLLGISLSARYINLDFIFYSPSLDTHLAYVNCM